MVQAAEVITLSPIASDRRDTNFKRIFNDIVSDLQYYDIESVADAAGISPQTLYNWINRNVKFPSTRTFMRVAQALGYEIILQRRQ